MKTRAELEKEITPCVPLLKMYWELLLKWQKSVNLISPNTIKDGWERHILDSAQLYFLIENQQHILMDVGSGGGLPAIVLAIINKTLNGPLTEIILVESDLKKSLFLAECARQLNLKIKIMRERVEKLSLTPDVITARAFAPLNELLKLIHTNVSRETILLLPKGKNVSEEITNNTYKCEIEKIKNIINSDGCVLKIRGIKYD